MKYTVIYDKKMLVTSITLTKDFKTIKDARKFAKQVNGKVVTTAEDWSAGIVKK